MMRHTLTLLSALLIAVPAWAQLAGHDLQILFNPGGHYVSPFYSGRPSSGAPFVFFEDEPIQVLIRFANWSDETLMLRAGGRSPGEAVSVRLYRISESGPVEVPVRLHIEGADAPRPLALLAREAACVVLLPFQLPRAGKRADVKFRRAG